MAQNLFWWKHRYRPARQHDRHRRRLDCLDFDVRRHIGAHFNPAVSMMATLQKKSRAIIFAVCDGSNRGGLCRRRRGARHVRLTKLFLPDPCTHRRFAMVEEFVATFGLTAVIISTSRTSSRHHTVRRRSLNPQRPIGSHRLHHSPPGRQLRHAQLVILSQAFAPIDALGFIVAQLAGALVALLGFVNWFYPCAETCIRKL